ncbi:ATP-binding cassette domain-containing protein, partial [bacterium]|nr:ATP-binding cassette domain-containing protein [bacterium]
MLVAEGLMVFYENMLALNNISIKCGENQIIGVFGANSAGKSTLMYTLSGIILDQMKKEKMRGGEQITVMGEISLFDQDISSLKPHLRARRGIVLCPERRRLFPESSVLENLKIGAYMATKKEAKETLDYVLEIFSPLKKLLHRSAGFLSGGEQQMAAIGRALMAQPKLLLLDEPLLGLSPAYQQVVMESVKRIREMKKISIIITE